MKSEYSSPRCPIRTTLDMLGGKWKLAILHQLRSGPTRYSDLRRGIPEISEKMLTQELKRLSSDGLVLRTDHQQMPPVVDYRLTDVGNKTLPLIDEIAKFGVTYERQVLGKSSE